MYKKGQAARLGPRPNTPYPRTQDPENTQLRPDSVGATYPIPAQASGDKDKKKKNGARKRFPKARAYSSRGSKGTRAFPGCFIFSSSLKHFLNRHKQNQIEQL